MPSVIALDAMGSDRAPKPEIEGAILAARQYDSEQGELKSALAEVFSRETLEHWLRLFAGEDVCVGPVATRAEAAAAFGVPVSGRTAATGEHTASWRQELAQRL